jgi:hypothetical protein
MPAKRAARKAAIDLNLTGMPMIPGEICRRRFETETAGWAFT